MDGHLPSIEVEGAIGSKSLDDPTARGAAAVAGAAPAVLRTRIDDVQRRSEDGIVVELREGPELIFGSASRLRAKWAAAARILADLEARGASYLDLRLPGRPGVGGLAAETVTPVAPAGPVGTISPTPTTPTTTADTTTTAPVTPDPATATLPTEPAQTAPPPAAAGSDGGAAVAP